MYVKHKKHLLAPAYLTGRFKKGDDAMNTAKLALVVVLFIILNTSIQSQRISDPSTYLAICIADQTQTEV